MTIRENIARGPQGRGQYFPVLSLPLGLGGVIRIHFYEKCTSPTPNLDSGIFTCLTPGYYTVSYSAYGKVGPSYGNIDMYLYKNGLEIPESAWYFSEDSGALNSDVRVGGSRIVVSNIYLIVS